MIKKSSRRSYSIFLGLLLLIPLTYILSIDYVNASAYDVWGSDTEKIIATDLDNYNYTQYVEFDIRKIVPAKNHPIEITPSFDDETCDPASIRILYKNDSQAGDPWVEVPYQNSSNYNLYPSGFLQSVNIRFAAPEVKYGAKYRLYWSYMDTKPSINPELGDLLYNKEDYINTSIDPIDTFFTAPDLNEITKSVEINKPGGFTDNFGIILPEVDLNKFDINVIDSNLTYIGKPQFNESTINTLDLGSGYDGVGPMSIKIIDGVTSGWGLSNEHFLVIGTFNGTQIYKYTESGTDFQYITGYSWPSVPSQPRSYGIAIGDVSNANGNDYEILLGLRNGTVVIFSFDGSTLNLESQLNNGDYPQAIKSYGIGLIPDAHLQDSVGVDEIMFTSSNDFGSAGYYSLFNETGTIGVMNEISGLGSGLEPEIPGEYVTSEKFSPLLYVDDFIPGSYHTNQEIILASEYNGDLIISMANITVNNTQQSDFLHILNSPIEQKGWYYKPLASMGSTELTAIAISNKLSVDTNGFNVVTATNGRVKMHNLTYSTLASPVDVVSYGNDYLLGLGLGNLLPLCGNLTDDGDNYDDVVIMGDDGRLYFFDYNSTINDLEYQTTQTISNGVDFAGVGYSSLVYDIDGESGDELIVAGSDGKVRVLKSSFPSNIKIDICEDGDEDGPGISTVNKYEYELVENFHDDIQAIIDSESYLIVINSGNGQRYMYFPINISADTRGIIELSNLFINYTTTDYMTLNVNQGLISFDPSLSQYTPIYIDNDQDNYPDLYEIVNRAFVDLIYYTGVDGSNITIHKGDSLPVSISLNYMNNDSDGDGILDGDELITYSTHPNKQDTDDDGLSDYYELFGPYSNLLGIKCVTNQDWDNDKVLDPIEIANNGNPQKSDTDDDGLSDYDELQIYHSYLNTNDSDNDGLSDYEESGESPNDLYNVINNRLRFYSFANGLNLTSADSDGDGLTDYEEIKGVTSVNWDTASSESEIVYFTSPVDNDTDGDNRDDYEEIMGAYSHFRLINFSDSGIQIEEMYLPIFTNPQDNDTDNDLIADGDEEQFFCHPLLSDTDNDKLTDGEEILNLLYIIKINEGQILLHVNATNPDTDNDGLLDGWEFYGLYNDKGYIVGSQSDPMDPNTDGDGWTDFEEVAKYYTDPNNPDSDGDGLQDDVDPLPMLSTLMTVLTYSLIAVGMVLSISTYPINKRAAKVAGRAKVEYKKKLDSIADRMERERKERKLVRTFARMMPSDLDSGKINVKINVRVIDPSFYCRQVKLWYSAGADEFREIMMDKIDDDNFAIVIGDIPLDITVLYYLELLDRGGVWLKQLRDEVEQKTYEFSTGLDGIKEASDWDDEGLIKCEVCGYMCRPDWESCPECNTPLHDTTQEIFMDDQIAKEEKLKRETDPDEIAWQEAQQTDEFWRGLAECPSCGFAVQDDWAACPVCNFDLTSAKLEKKAVYDDVETDMDYVEGKEVHNTYKDDTEKLKSAKDEKKEMEEIKKRKEKQKKDEWGSGTGDRDVL